MTFTGTLLPYQPEAVDRMCQRGRMLVAYDLGLGKTVLTIAAIERLMDENKIKEPGLIICLSSLKYQWANQIEKFTNGTNQGQMLIDSTAAIYNPGNGLYFNSTYPSSTVVSRPVPASAIARSERTMLPPPNMNAPNTAAAMRSAE